MVERERDIDLILFAIKYSANFYCIKIFFSFRSKMLVNGTLQERDQIAQITGIDFRPADFFEIDAVFMCANRSPPRHVNRYA